MNIQNPVSSEETGILKSANDNVIWSEVRDFEPNKYYQTRKGLWVAREFKSVVLRRVGSGNVPAAAGFSKNLTSNAYNGVIKQKLEDAFRIFSELEACAYIAQMIDKQPDGTPGELTDTGMTNLFFIPDAVIGIAKVVPRDSPWSWFVSAWPEGTSTWEIEDRVFCRI